MSDTKTTNDPNECQINDEQQISIVIKTDDKIDCDNNKNTNEEIQLLIEDQNINNINNNNNTNTNNNNKDEEEYDDTINKSTEDTININSPTKSILSNGNLINQQRRNSKKSVSFDPDDETVKKFTDGDIIVDKKNPFKNGILIDSGTTTIINDKKFLIKLRKNLDKRKTYDEPDFVSTEDVLRESKYVQTYIKNPDKYFTYDPTVIARIKFDELKELKDKKPPSRKVRLSPQTQERLKELKSKYSPSPLYAQTKVSKPKQIDQQQQQQQQSQSKIPTYKKVSKANYPDLSQIKVKTGTDLEGSFFNPEEVALNAKKFDDRVKKLHISSEDDLDEIDEVLTKSDSSDELKIEQTINKITNNNNNNNIHNNNSNNNNISLKDETKSFTNTVNSKEFQEYLTKKGLLLTPKQKLANGKLSHNNNNKTKNSHPSSIIAMEQTLSTTTTKKVKKPSMFQRLLPSSIFSSKRKTTPKEQVPIPQNLYNNSVAATKDDDFKTSSSSSNIKRVVLERQSFHGGSGGGTTNNNSTYSNDLRKQVERSRKSYGGDDRSSSISSALTNAEDFGDIQSNDSLMGSRNLYIDVRQNPQNPQQQYQQSNDIIKNSKSRSTISKDSKLQNFQTKSAEIRDGVIKPRVQRASIPISSLKPLPNKSLDRNEKQLVPPIKRSTLDRQSLIVQRRPNQIITDDEYGRIGRSSSMDRQEISRRTNNNNNNNNKMNTIATGQIRPSTSSRNSTLSQKSIITPKNSNSNLIDNNNGPQKTSTPLQDKEGDKMMSNENISPISMKEQQQTTKQTDFNNVGPFEWEKLREIKERTDRELFKQLQLAKLTNYNENIYEKLPIQQKVQQQPQQQQQQQIPNQQPLYAQLMPETNFMRGSPQRNTFSGIYRNRNVKVIDGNTIHPIERRTIPIEADVHQVNIPQQPPRSQSVLDEMLVPHQQATVYGSIAGTPVVMRRKETPSLSREEILNRVKEFCRKSMNNTPTKHLLGSNQQLHNEQNSKLPSDISPVSYASVEYQRGRTIPKILAPQVPQRVQSLQQHSQVSQQTPSTSPIYAHVIKRNSIQSNVSDIYDSPARNRISSSSDPNHPMNRGRLATVSDTDSVFLPNNQSQQQQQQQPSSPGGRYVVMDSDKVTPAHVMKFRDRTGNDVYGHLLPSPYGYIQVKPQQISTTPQNHRIRMDGRTTPVILETQSSPIYWNNNNNQQQSTPRYSQLQPSSTTTGNVVYLRVKDQVYRPINPNRVIQPNVYPNGRSSFPYESESGSEAGEVQRIMQNRRIEEDWQNDKSGRNQSGEQASDDRRRAGRREDPRRHTLGGDMLQYGGGQGQPQQRAMDLEMGTRAQKSKKTPPIRGYTPINQGPLFDDDPGIMSEVETASTGFRRGGKQRSSLPVVRTPSKTLERPLGLVFLQYRSETKRALLPNEITSIDTVRALFVRSFPRQLTMAYLEGPNVKIYIHDASKDMFYELEDVRSHLREIRDRSVLRLFESNEVAAPQVLPGGPGVPQPLPQSGSGHWDQDQSYFSEPEFDSEYQHQHIHKSKGGKPAPYYVGGTQTLPRGMFSDRGKNSVDGYSSSPERGTRGGYEEPYYSQYGTRGPAVAPIIDEEQRVTEAALQDDQYSLYGMKVSGRIPRTPNQLYDPTRPEDLHRIRVEHMERQLANLTGLVQKALNQNPQMPPQVGAINSNYLGVPGQCRGDKSVSFEKSVSFSDDIQGVPKSHSPQHAADSKPPKPAIKSSTLPRTSSQERDRLKPPPPPKPLALASTHPNYRPDIALAPEVYNHLRGLQKKAKDLRMEVRTLRRLSQAQAVAVREDIKDAFMRIRATLIASNNYWGEDDKEKASLTREAELYKQEVQRLEKDIGELEVSVEGLRGEVINRRTRVNMAAVEDMALVLSRSSNTVARLKMQFPYLYDGLSVIVANEMERVVGEDKFLNDEPERLETALRRCKKLTGTLVTLKRLASVQEQRLPVAEPINEDPPRSAEISSTNKPIPSPRLGSITVDGGIAPENALDALLDELQTFAKPHQPGDIRPDDSTSDDSSQALHNTITTQLSQNSLFPTNDPNAQQQLLQQQQVNNNLNSNNLANLNNIINNNNINNNNNNNTSFSQTTISNIGSLRRLHSYPSGSDTDTSPPQPPRPVGKPPVPERNADLLSKVGNKRIPPPPPPRTSSRSPLASPTSPNIPPRLPSLCETDQLGNGSGGSGNSSGNESGNDHVQRQLALEMRHQELLKKQKMLQEQYARLQQMSKNALPIQPTAAQTNDLLALKKTGSESNLPQKMGLNMTITGSMKNLNADIIEKNDKNSNTTTKQNQKHGNSNKETTIDITNNLNKTSTIAGTGTGTTTTSKVYETDIL